MDILGITINPLAFWWLGLVFGTGAILLIIGIIARLIEEFLRKKDKYAFSNKRTALVDKYKNNPNEVTKEDLIDIFIGRYADVSSYAIKDYMWDTNNWGGTTQIGKFIVSHAYEREELSNSDKSIRYVTNHTFTITDTETNETFTNASVMHPKEDPEAVR